MDDGKFVITSVGGQDFEGSLSEVVDWMWTASKEMIALEGNHPAVVVVFYGSEFKAIIVDEVMGMSGGKEIVSTLMHRVAMDNDVMGVGLITEAWAKMTNSAKEMNEILEGKERDKTIEGLPGTIEILSFAGEFRGGGTFMKALSINRDDGGNITELKDIDTLQIGSHMGRFSGMFAMGTA